MLEMEADLPLSNNQLQAELKKEMKGEGGVEGGGDGDAARYRGVSTAGSCYWQCNMQEHVHVELPIFRHAVDEPGNASVQRRFAYRAVCQDRRVQTCPQCMISPSPNQGERCSCFL